MKNNPFLRVGLPMFTFMTLGTLGLSFILQSRTEMLDSTLQRGSHQFSLEEERQKMDDKLKRDQIEWSLVKLEGGRADLFVTNSDSVIG